MEPQSIGRSPRKHSSLPGILTAAVWLVTGLLPTMAQNIGFKHITVETGLAQNSVMSITQDSIGFLWFGTQNGLTRYSGYEFQTFETRFQDSTTLPNNFINALCPDGSKLWVGTRDGLCYWDVRVAAFFRPSQMFEGDTLQGHYDFWDIIKDSRGTIWALGESNGFHVFRKDKPDSHFTKVLELQQPAHNKVLDLYGQLLEDDQGNIWIGTSKCGLWMYQRKDKRFVKIQIANAADYSITSIAQNRRGQLWIGTVKNGLFQYTEGHFTSVKGLNDLAIRSLFVDSRDRLWVGTDKGGLNLLHASPGSFAYYDRDISNTHSLLHNSVWSIFEDRQHIIWVGTYAGGVSYYDPNVGSVQHYQAGPDRKKNLSDNTVSGFAEDADGNIWVATDRGGLNYLDRQNKTFQHYQHDAENLFSLSSDVVQHVTCTSRGQLWAATWLGGLNYFDSSTKRFYAYTAGTSPNGIASLTVNYLLEDSKKNLWIGTSAGLDFVNEKYLVNGVPPKLNVRHHTQDRNTPRSLSNDYAKVIFEDKEQNIWVGTQNGINLFDQASQAFENYLYNPRRKKIFTPDYVICIAQTPEGNFLLGTNDNGLLIYYAAADSLTVHNKQSGFYTNTVYGILRDDHNNYWMSSTNGLIKYNPFSNSFVLFNQYDGLQSSEFKSNAALRLKSGEMLFGGIRGFNLFHPDSIKQPTIASPLIISKLKLSNHEITPANSRILREDISLTRKIELDYNQFFISLEFNSLDFSLPQKTQYAFRLSGVDKDWNYVGTARSANYSYLAPGEYTFEVKSSLNNGMWSSPVSLLMIIHPPWWNTWWFRASSFLGLALILAVAYKRRTHQLQMRRKILEHIVEERTAELQQKNHLLEENKEEILQQKEALQQQRDHVEQQYNTIQSLSEMGQRITASIHKEELILQLHNTLARLMDIAMFSIGHLNDKADTIEFSTIHDVTEGIKEVNVSLGEERLSVECIRRKEAIIIHDTAAEAATYLPELVGQYLSSDLFRSAIYLPLFSTDRQITGVMIVKSIRTQAYTALHLNTLKSLAAYISIAYENATVYNAIEAQSMVLSRQSKQLKELDELKTRFFINISHEFRTPLTLILSPLEKILSQSKPQDWGKLRRQLELMSKNAQQLLGLINELLEIRHFESTGSMKLQAAEHDIVAFVEATQQRFETLASQYNIRLNLRADHRSILLWFDKDMMGKVLMNLFSNAFKYTPKGGRIESNIAIIRDATGESVRLTIFDTGAGIPEKELPYVFERFYQGEAPLNAIQGSSGIGLSLVKDLVEIQGGRITVEGKSPHGTAFIIEFPLRSGHFQEAVATGVTSSPVPGLLTPGTDEECEMPIKKNMPLLLIIEDHSDVKEFLWQEFESNYSILSAANGEDGVNLALAHVPDIIVSDIMMPVMDGIQVCNLLKADQRTSHVPIILLTAKTGEESHIKGLETGADDYISKPFNVNILRARVQNLIASRRKLHALFSVPERVEVINAIENVHDRHFIEKIDSAIKANMKNPEFTHEMLTREIGMSKTQLYRKLQSITGKTVHEYIRNHRLKYAHRLLQEQNEMLIFEVAYEVGFKDPAYFSKSFHSLYNLWPTDLKKVRT